LNAADRRLDMFEDYRNVHSMEFDAQGRGGLCPCDNYWEVSRSYDRFVTDFDVPPPPADLEAKLERLISKAWSGAPIGDLFAAPKQDAQSVTTIMIGDLRLWIPSSPLTDGGATAMRDRDRRVGLVEVTDLVTPEQVAVLLTARHPEVELVVMDDFTIYREMTVVHTPTDPERQCTVLEAREVDVDAGVGDTAYWPIPLPWGHLVMQWVGHAVDA